MADGNVVSEVRVFLSADLVGSTKLKNQLNHQELLAKYGARKDAISKLHRHNGVGSISDAAATTAVLESLGVSDEDIDWASVVEFFYSSIHSEFESNLTELSNDGVFEFDFECKPWKAVGDELIYQFPVRSRLELHWLAISFLKALRSIDKKVADRAGAERGLRIKGTGWTAGFPVRNRIIKLPAINTEDFLGPDIDTGFRIGKCTQPGMLAISVEMAELLSQTPGRINPIVGKRVGWEKLKGVWNDHQYPVIWIDLPSGYAGTDGRLAATEFTPWQQLDSAWCKTWADGSPTQPLRELAKDLRKLRVGLPKSLGLVTPYIVVDSEFDDEVPDEHRQVLELLRLVDEHQEQVEKQVADEPEANTQIDTERSIAKINELFADRESSSNTDVE